MLIPKQSRQCVVFLLYRDQNQNLRFAGTGFFIEIEVDWASFVYLVTAKHVIVAVQQRSVDGKVHVRLNDRQGDSKIVETDIKDWEGHPNDSSVDVSVFRWVPPPAEYEYYVIPSTIIATNEVIENADIGPGDEVYITGLFSNHVGKTRNIPIVRVGNIAAMPEEKVNVKHFGDIDAYLIEARSIGGLSGSPVFVHLSVERVGADVDISTEQAAHYLLGFVHGHWDVDENAVDGLVQDIKSNQVNMGIAIVVPATKILEILNQPGWMVYRQLAVNMKDTHHFRLIAQRPK